MKKFLSILLSAAMCFSAAFVPTTDAAKISSPSGIADSPKQDASGTILDIMDWSLSGGTLYFSGNSKMPNWASASGVPWYKMRGEIRTAVLENGIKSLGAYSFSGCSNLTNIQFPSDITEVATHCLNGTAISSISIPSGVTLIGLDALRDCPNLRDVYIYNPNCTIYGESSTISNSTVDKYFGNFNGTIHGYSGSTAEKYANRFGMKFSVITGSEPIQTTVSRSTVSKTTTTTTTKTTSSGKTSGTTTVQPKLEVGLSIRTLPVKVTYNTGENLNYAGGYINSYYEYTDNYGKKTKIQNSAMSFTDSRLSIDSSQFKTWEEGTYPIYITYTQTYKNLTASNKISFNVDVKRVTAPPITSSKTTSSTTTTSRPSTTTTTSTTRKTTTSTTTTRKTTTSTTTTTTTTTTVTTTRQKNIYIVKFIDADTKQTVYGVKFRLRTNDTDDNNARDYYSDDQAVYQLYGSDVTVDIVDVPYGYDKDSLSANYRLSVNNSVLNAEIRKTVMTSSSSSTTATTTSKTTSSTTTTTTTTQPPVTAPGVELKVTFDLISQPFKTVYTVGEELNFDGAKVGDRVYFNNGAGYVEDYGYFVREANCGEYEIDASQFDNTKSGTYTIYITKNLNCHGYRDIKTVSFNVTVNVPDYIKGDVNFDGVIDSRDASLVLREYAECSANGGIPFGNEPLKRLAADINQDNTADGRDASFILAYYAKTSTQGEHYRDILEWYDLNIR